ncbi:MAG TPA: hypothetical protein VFO78_05915 [Candidatus Limnocylindrales bacterium]|nr:hypothetical protein [Candidatus Limnocylindrales bacterium]
MNQSPSAATSPDVPGPAPAVPGPAPVPLMLLDDDPRDGAADPALVVLTCASCGAAMDERKCKLICRCGYFLSCSDYY